MGAWEREWQKADYVDYIWRSQDTYHPARSTKNEGRDAWYAFVLGPAISMELLPVLDQM